LQPTRKISEAKKAALQKRSDRMTLFSHFICDGSRQELEIFQT